MPRQGRRVGLGANLTPGAFKSIEICLESEDLEAVSAVKMLHDGSFGREGSAVAMVLLPEQNYPRVSNAFVKCS